MVDIKIYNTSNYSCPKYETAGSAGLDLKADILEDITLKPGDRVLIPTGLHIELPEGYEAQIRPRSGLALKSGLTVLNAPGTIDADYRGNIGVIIINLNRIDVTITPGERIAQMVISKFEKANFIKVDSIEELNATDRGDGGFGHTGK